MTEPESPTYTAGVPAIDHHSHAGYLRPGARVEGIDGVEREMALDHVEAQVPSEVYLEYIEAERLGDHERVATLDREHGFERHFADGMRFHETSMHTVSLREGTRALYGDLPHAEHVRLSLERRHDDPRGLYDEALRIAGTPAVLTDVPELDARRWPRAVYMPIARLDPYLFPFGHPTWERRGSDTPRFRRIFSAVLERQLELGGISELPATLGEYLEFVRSSIARRRDDGFVGLKIASAYVRSLSFQHVETEAAAAVYTSALAGGAPDARENKILADHVLYEIARTALALDLPIQVHTGVGHAEPGLRVADSDPLGLQDLLDRPELNRVRFILIHGGFPFTDRLAALAFGHGNVFLDVSLLPQMHGRFLDRTLEDWLTYLPANKVMFGTDTGNPEHHVSSATRARAALERVLRQGVAESSWSPAQAGWLAERVLHQNLCDVYGVSLP